ncbi:endoplasmic reticulum mannosyl-oligosaccharide 1,2-alpha-mannosidase [Vanessa tameamea]|uniref:alpha-1,2-Mannosidase n=1 Tax=Vanessa tameamea TaxID=334116 RepID=A0A8B8IUN4_VANTA|nr:endoplasmic reticulum mannosyl-oligosaccharide 1,2-alpha-mannosidase [Vanessa tameamea]XP_026500860.1 endoplasmic reticulum mannosyl-oligosaccharide 1,2-alpha-mannosidase [Vanessa tameamea]XP_026500862.1 endoplasmic reticulum mannosyl-oligosaccharide 1,2-alpha-mannosidase [Vanessa tameamea]
MNLQRDTKIDLSGPTIPTIFKSNKIDAWNDSDSDENFDQSISHRKIIRRWNQLSRLQRSLIYVFFTVLVTVVLVILCLPKPTSDVNKIKRKLEQNALKNVSHAKGPASNLDQVKKVIYDIEVNERPVFSGPGNARQFAVVESFKHAWRGYKEHAWGHDNLKPVSGMAYDWFSLGLTIVDSLDTAYIMGCNEEFEEGKQWIKNELIFTKNKDVNFFEVTIRVLGALLTNYHFTEDTLFLDKAKDLGERLMAAFSSPSGIPYSDVNLGTRTAHAPEWSHYSTTAEVTTVQLEFRELSRATNNPMFEDAATAVSEKIHQLPKKRGLVPIFINPNTGHFLPHATITLGARGDSYYEYLLKQWLQTGKTINYLLDDYVTAIEGVREYLAKRSSPNKRLFIGELASGSEAFNPKMDHLTCFLPGTLALGHANGLPGWHMTMAEELLYTCYLTYAAHPTFLAPEITHFNMVSATDDMYTKTADAHSLLRPEFVESLWYMYQLTGNTTYQDWGWQIYQGFEKYAKVTNGYTSLANVKSEKPIPRDMMESFFMSETLKYLYLLFSEDRYIIDLNKYVINSEAHPLPVHKN